MSQKLQGGLPSLLDLAGGWQLIFRAVDPTTGADIASVNIDTAAFAVELISDSTAEQLQVGPFMLVEGPAA